MHFRDPMKSCHRLLGAVAALLVGLPFHVHANEGCARALQAIEGARTRDVSSELVEALYAELREQAARLTGDEIDELLRQVATAPATSRRAQLVLAQIDSLPRGWRAQATNSGSLVGRVYVRLREGLPELQPRGPGDWPVRTGGVGVHDRLGAQAEPLAAQIGRRLELEPSTLEQANPDFVADYQATCLPRLRTPTVLLAHARFLEARLEPDGPPSLVIVSDRTWETHWLHELNFVAVAKRSTVGGLSLVGPWRLPEGARVRRVEVLDLDGDGCDEVGVWVDLLGARAPSRQFGVVHARGVTWLERAGDAPGPRLFVLDDGVTVVTEERDWSGAGGAAREPQGVLARAHVLYRWRDGQFVASPRVWLPYRATSRQGGE